MKLLSKKKKHFNFISIVLKLNYKLFTSLISLWKFTKPLICNNTFLKYLLFHLEQIAISEFVYAMLELRNIFQNV